MVDPIVNVHQNHWIELWPFSILSPIDQQFCPLVVHFLHFLFSSIFFSFLFFFALFHSHRLLVWLLLSISFAANELEKNWMGKREGMEERTTNSSMDSDISINEARKNTENFLLFKWRKESLSIFEHFHFILICCFTIHTYFFFSVINLWEYVCMCVVSIRMNKHGIAFRKVHRIVWNGPEMHGNILVSTLQNNPWSVWMAATAMATTARCLQHFFSKEKFPDFLFHLGEN